MVAINFVCLYRENGEIVSHVPMEENSDSYISLFPPNLQSPLKVGFTVRGEVIGRKADGTKIIVPRVGGNLETSQHSMTVDGHVLSFERHGWNAAQGSWITENKVKAAFCVLTGSDDERDEEAFAGLATSMQGHFKLGLFDVMRSQILRPTVILLCANKEAADQKILQMERLRFTA